MPAKLLPGSEIAKTIQQELKQTIISRHSRELNQPGLDVILVGNNPASASYVGHKQRACDHVGIRSHCHRLPETTSQATLLNLIQTLNNNPATHGILLQLPLPPHLDSQSLLSEINPDKDVDGFHPTNIGKLALRQPHLRPCTPYGVITLLQHTQEKLAGKHAVVIGASNIVGRPMALELLLQKCTVTVCHRYTPDLTQHITQADILISATGQFGLIDSQHIKQGSIVIDVGFSKLSNGRIIGDIDFATAKERASWITPVPGGVGPMTVATLLQNTIKAAQHHD